MTNELFKFHIMLHSIFSRVVDYAEFCGAIHRDATEIKREFKLKEDDILRVGSLILPAANFAISKARRIFSGEPAMTLKVILSTRS